MDRRIQSRLNPIHVTGRGGLLSWMRLFSAGRLNREPPVVRLHINRDTAGAVMRSNPFDERGLSGAGPKAGDPNYQRKLISKNRLTDNVIALGGNTMLFNLE